MPEEKPMSQGEKMIVAAMFCFMIGFYEHSLIGHNHGANDVFYIVSSWGLWIVSPCFAVAGLLKMMRSRPG